MAGWTQLTAAAAWPARYAPGFLHFQGRFWLFGGYNGGFFDDVWSSADCITWVQEVVNAPWVARDEFPYLIYNNRMWLCGGYRGGAFPGREDDVWSTVDGVNWVQEIDPAVFGANSSMVALDFGNNDNLYRFVMCGGSRAGWGNNSYGSNDLVTWVVINNANIWNTSFIGEASAELNGRIWLVGGYSNAGARLNAVWSSGDGINWTNNVVEGTAPWAERLLHFVTNFNNKLWIFGGDTGAGYVNDTWMSVDGTNWTERSLTYDANYTIRRGHRCLEVGGRVYLVGGQDGGGYLNDVWVLDDLVVSSAFTANGTPSSDGLSGDAPFGVDFESLVGEGTWTITDSNGTVIYLTTAVFFYYLFGFPGIYQVLLVINGVSQYTMTITVTRFRIIATPPSGQAPLTVRFGF